MEALQVRDAASSAPSITNDFPAPAVTGGNAQGAAGNSEVVTGKVLPHAAAPDVTNVHRAAALIDRFLRDAGRELSFSVDDVTGIVVVAVRDPRSGELIRQMPSAEVLRIASNLAERGPALVDELA